MISRWAGHRKVLCPVVFMGGVSDAERVANGCPEDGEGTGPRRVSQIAPPPGANRFTP